MEEFSATQTTSRGGRPMHTSKVFVAPQKMRVEMPHPSGRGSLVTIVRQDRQLMWLLMPEQRVYRESVLNEADLRALTQQVKDDQVVEELGRETVAGYPCRKLRVRTKVTVMGQTHESTSTVWHSRRLGLPLRSEQDGGVTTELKDIVPARQPADIFELPSDYREVKGVFPGMLDPRGRAASDERGKPDLGAKLRELAKRR